MITRPIPTSGHRARRTAAATVVVALSMGAMAGCGEDDGAAQDTTSPTAESSTAQTASTDATSTDPATADSPTDTSTTEEPAAFVTPYFVGDTPQGARLYRELRTDLPAERALDALTGSPTDPDYRTLLPEGSLSGDYSVDGTGKDAVLSVEVADESWTERPAGLSAAKAALAVQQVVWTLQTVHAGEEFDPTARTKASVAFTLDGEEVDFLGIGGPTKAKPELRVLASVNVLTGLERPLGASKSPVTGMASSFEATVPWEIQDADGRVVQESFSTADGWMGGLYPFTAVLEVGELAPGEYTFVARTDDPSGGEGGGPTEDTKTFTVE